MVGNSRVNKCLMGVVFFFMLMACKESETKNKVEERPLTLEQKASKLMGSYGCLGCHSADGSRLVGPTFKNIWGRKTRLQGGGELVVDEDYLKRSILAPQSEIVEGYTVGVMPTVKANIDEIQLMVDYLKTL